VKIAGRRVRADGTALRFWRELRRAVRVPPGRAIVVTLQAPIKVPKKAVAALSDLLQRSITSDRKVKRRVLGNKVWIRIRAGSAKLIGYVFTDEVDPDEL